MENNLNTTKLLLKQERRVGRVKVVAAAAIGYGIFSTLAVIGIGTKCNKILNILERDNGAEAEIKSEGENKM